MNILSKCLIKEQKIKPLTLGGKTEITIRQLTAGEGLEYQSILRDEEKTQEDAVFFAVKCAMVDPVFFSDEELEKLNITGKNLIYEIHSELPMIGMTKKEREDYLKKMEEIAKSLMENKKEETSEEDVEKK